MKKVIPDFLLEMSNQMKEQPSRMTSHPFWQVRCNRYPVTVEGYNEHHWVLVDEDGEFFRSDLQDNDDMLEIFKERYPDFCNEYVKSTEEDLDTFDIEFDDLPKGVARLFVQEVEEVISTHFTQSDAEWFIKRKQHDYPPLFTYVESAYWSPQIKQLQDWIIELTNEVFK